MQLRPSKNFRLEALEDRTCPSVTSWLSVGVLTIHGHGGDVVFIAAGRQNEFHVKGHDHPYFPVERVLIALGNGHNTVNIDLTNAGSANVEVRTGDGDDAVNVSLGTVQPGGDVQIKADLGAGAEEPSEPRVQ